MRYSTNLNLYLPDNIDNFIIDAFNKNTNIIGTEISELKKKK